ncbi:MAG: type II toxin-antitoxin system RelE/ParE family toxin [Clostridia bacterium]|nr:type II toxin-antitoxin system RelE/ParE family toxin [Clostridia bacterium]
MSFKVIYTPEARIDLRNITEYISNNLSVPETARKQAGRIMSSIQGLEELPYRHSVYNDEPWKSQGMRYFPVDNYLIFYLPVEQTQSVHVLRIMYGGRDISTQLSDKDRNEGETDN